MPGCRTSTSISPGIKLERPVYSGKAIENLTTSENCVITIRPNSIEAAEMGGSAEITSQDSTESIRLAVLEAIAKASEKIDVSEADIIISGGRGLGDASNFEKLEEVASTLGAAVGASRAVVDEWGLPHSMQRRIVRVENFGGRSAAAILDLLAIIFSTVSNKY